MSVRLALACGAASLALVGAARADCAKLPNLKLPDTTVKSAELIFTTSDKVTLALYNALAKQLGGVQEVQNFAGLFMLPGVAHCGGGAGPNSFNSASVAGGPTPPFDDPHDDIFTALTYWVEDGIASSQVVTTKYVADNASKGIAMRRPLCPYPEKAWCKGDGDTNDAGNLTCAFGEQVAFGSSTAKLGAKQELCAVAQAVTRSE